MVLLDEQLHLEQDIDWARIVQALGRDQVVEPRPVAFILRPQNFLVRSLHNFDNTALSAMNLTITVETMHLLLKRSQY